MLHIKKEDVLSKLILLKGLPIKNLKELAENISKNFDKVFYLKGDLKVGDVDNIRNDILLASSSNNMIFIIQESGKLKNIVQNMLLKTTEEISPYASVVVLCDDESNLLKTFVSRCVEINLWNEFLQNKEKYLCENEDEKTILLAVIQELCKKRITLNNPVILEQLYVLEEAINNKVGVFQSEGAYFSFIKTIENILIFSKIKLPKELNESLSKIKRKLLASFSSSNYNF